MPKVPQKLKILKNKKKSFFAEFKNTYALFTENYPSSILIDVSSRLDKTLLPTLKNEHGKSSKFAF